ncbi:MAG: acyl-CoA thioesterase II [Chromatiales bacterium]|jgi:acyl-CoA thioesterase-2|nr:MAG: acyl-CoA thioesterase II [Chromatiales bacterium]
MTDRLKYLTGMLDLETIETNIFRGQSSNFGTEQVFGGQILGQALAAASRTVDGRAVHSLHAYFLKRGDMQAPVVYNVDRARDGGSFSNRRVVAIQHGEQIFNMTASFQTPESGLEHQVAMPQVPKADDLKDLETLAREHSGELPPRMRRFLNWEQPFDVRPVDSRQFFSPDSGAPVKLIWMRTSERLPEDSFLHQAVLACISDYELIGTATLPHGLHAMRDGLQVASLDHAMWFHRPVRVDEWLLFALDSPAASGGRGLARGYVFTEDGKLVATLAQEGLIRVRPAK